ncbi:MAG: prenyltransferase [Gemmatimonadaceae bacterium]|nr:prenyltransferase [Gemmatimonadaceae bacterium]
MSATPIDLTPASAGTAIPGASTRGLALWLQTARVQSFAITSIGILVGAAVAWTEGAWHPRVLLAWMGGVLLQAGTNLLNVSYNYKGGTRGGLDPKGSSAPVRTGLLAASQVRRAAVACFIVGSVLGFWLVAETGWWVLALGIVGVFFGWCYSAPPLRLSYRGFGVLAAAVCMGPGMVLGAHHVVTRTPSMSAWVAAIAVGLLAGGILHVNDLRDFDGDVAHGKRTLSTLLGRARARQALLGLDVAAFLVVGAGIAARVLPATTALVLLALPAVIAQVRAAYRATDHATLNAAWFQSVRVHAQFGVLLAVGLVLGAR